MSFPTRALAPFRARLFHLSSGSRLCAAALAMLLAVGSLIPVSAGAAAAATDTLDQQQTTFVNGWLIILGTGNAPGQIVGQTFRAGATGDLTRVSVLVEHSSDRNGGPYGDLIAQIQSVDATGVPTGTILASATIPETAIPPNGAPAFVDAVFAAPPRVTAGTPYAIVLVKALDSGQSYNWRESAADTYPDGALVAAQGPFGSNSAFVLTSEDAAFKTYVGTAAITDTLDQQQPISDNIRAGVAGTGNNAFQIVAQTFRAGLTGDLTRASVLVEHGPQQFCGDGPCGLYGDLVTQIRSVDAAGVPTGTVLASATIPEAAIPPFGAPAFVDAVFAAPPRITAGTSYAIVLVRVVDNSNGQSDQSYDWMVSATNTYPNGVMLLGNGTFSSSGIFANNDAAFKTYVGTVKADTTPPVTTLSLAPAAPNGANGWYTSPVTARVAATDPDDAAATIQTRCVLDPATAPTNFTALPAGACPYLGPGATVGSDGSHTLYAASQDAAGNVESTVRRAAFELDGTAPTISAAPTTAPNASGWYAAPVTVHFACVDATSGIPAGACPSDQLLRTEGSAVSSTAQTVADTAGNTSAASNVVTVAIDTTAPLVGLTGVANGATYTLGSVPATGCTTSDALSGVATQASLQVTGGTPDGVGTFTATCSGAQDRAGNTAAPVSASYTVVYTASGLLAPLDNPNTVHTGKAGRTYPLKFQLTSASGAPISSLSAVASITYKPTGCSAFSGDPTDALETSTTGNTSLRYDSTTNQFIYNWATPGAGCYTLFVTLDSGQVFPAFFSLS